MCYTMEDKSSKIMIQQITTMRAQGGKDGLKTLFLRPRPAS